MGKGSEGLDPEGGGSHEDVAGGRLAEEDLGVSEVREIYGSPPTKGWINPNDWEEEGGALRLGI